MKILKAAAAIIIAGAVAFTAAYGKSGIAENGVSVSPAEYKGIITLWQIDSFEGGVGSRKQFLLSAARGFEKTNAGVLIMVVGHTAESAELEMSEGRFPDLISYGVGVNISRMQPIQTQKSQYGGGFNGEIYALPWCRGGYCVIENPDYVKGKNATEEIIVSQGKTTNPLLAYALSGKSDENFNVLSPMNAYVRFVSGKARYMIGTQRDIHRLMNRGMDFISKPLEGYNDLYQYISATSVLPEKLVYARAFIDYLLSEETQKRLSDIGMMSCYYKVEYQSPDLAAMQTTKSSLTVSAFSTVELIEKLREIGAAAATGNNEEIIKIKKLLATC
ncbi:MAG: hypothetical protein IJU83_01010 [Clostridia bacterium]|nr:hypothetical protein [Clostridia bacterium]